MYQGVAVSFRLRRSVPSRSRIRGLTLTLGSERVNETEDETCAEPGPVQDVALPMGRDSMFH